MLPAANLLRSSRADQVLPNLRDAPRPSIALPLRVSVPDCQGDPQGLYGGCFGIRGTALDQFMARDEWGGWLVLALTVLLLLADRASTAPPLPTAALSSIAHSGTRTALWTIQYCQPVMPSLTDDRITGAITAPSQTRSCFPYLNEDPRHVLNVSPLLVECRNGDWLRTSANL